MTKSEKLKNDCYTEFSLKETSGLEGIRTPDRSVKSRLLHLAELQAQKQERGLYFIYDIRLFFLAFLFSNHQP